jgi:hypothetical protein
MEKKRGRSIADIIKRRAVRKVLVNLAKANSFNMRPAK